MNKDNERNHRLSRVRWYFCVWISLGAPSRRPAHTQMAVLCSHITSYCNQSVMPSADDSAENVSSWDGGMERKGGSVVQEKAHSFLYSFGFVGETRNDMQMPVIVFPVSVKYFNYIKKNIYLGWCALHSSAIECVPWKGPRKNETRKWLKEFMAI